MRFRPRATSTVLALLCAMYFITYVDRVNIGTAASGIQRDLGLSNAELGWVFSAFGWPYLLFQVSGGWVADRFGPRRTLFWGGLVWAGATVLTGFAGSLSAVILLRILLWLGEGATFPTATRAMRTWVSQRNRGFAQGLTHAFSRLGSALTPPVVAIIMVTLTWRASFIVVGLVSLAWVFVWVWYFRDDPREHPAVTAAELVALQPGSAQPAAPRPVPWALLLRRLWPVTLTYFCYGWGLWLYLNWIPLFLKNTYHLDVRKSALFASGIFFGGVLGDTLGGITSDALMRRTGNVRFARLCVIVTGFLGALACLTPIYFVHGIDTVALCLTGALFFGELVIGPIWSVPLDIAPLSAGTAAGVMNCGSALAAIVSPLIAGFVIERTHDWYLPFVMTTGVMLLGALCALLINP